MTRHLALAALLLAGPAQGCTLVNAPDRDLQPPDGGMGGAGGDTGIELFCDDAIDDDDDSLTDCEDQDCAEDLACCERRTPTVTEDWTAPDLRQVWTFAPADDWTPARPMFDGETYVGDFGSADQPRALVSGDCLSLALGGWVSSALRTTDVTGCTNDAPCERYAGIVLSVSNTSSPGNKLPDELAVTLHAGGLVLVTQADVEIARATAPIDETVDVEMHVRPTLDDEAQPVLLGEVRIGDDTIIEEFPVAPVEALVASGACTEVPGLHVGVQSQGDGVYVGPLTAEKQDCANPGQFEKQVATLTASSLRFAPGWRAAYVGAPTLASSLQGSDVQWDLIVEGSNDLPELEPVTHVGYAVGHARNRSDSGEDWSLDGWASSDGPKAGDDPPSCVDDPPSCAANISVREPHLLAELTNQGAIRDLVLAFAREISPDPPDVFGLEVVKPVGNPASALELSTTPTLSPDDVPGCQSLRDPSLIPADPDALEGYWLMFACNGSTGAPSEIHAVRLSRALEVIEEGGEPLRRVVLAAGELGPFASAGIRSPEPLVSFTEDGLRLRVWFLAQRVPGEWAVALAEGRTHDTATLTFELPEMLPFPVNPILTNESPLVRSDCLGEECSITGIAVAPRGDDPEVLRFVLARRVNLIGTGPTDQLIPLEQLWSMP